MEGFQIAGASVPGMDHIMPGQPGWKNNQDAYAWRQSPNGIVAVVCDGCSSGEYSEVGAELGSRIIVDAAANLLVGREGILDSEEGSDVFCHDLMEETLDRVNDIAWKIDASFKANVENYFLFTMLCLVMAPKTTLIISCGDGVYAANGKVSVIGPYPGNAPPYLAYRLIPSDRRVALTRRGVYATDQINSVLIGSDGVVDLVNASEMTIPGLKEQVGPLSQFWSDDAFFANPDKVRRRLALINRETVIGGHLKRGLLRDDTTLIVLRRIP